MDTRIIDPAVFAGLTTVQAGIAFGAAFAAAFVRGLAGFGMAILLVPVLALALTPVEAVFVANGLTLLIGFVGLRRTWRSAERSALVIAGIGALCVPAGALALVWIAPDNARLVLAAIAVSAFLAVLPRQAAAARPGPLVTVATGAAAGVLTGFAGMPGPPVVPFYLRRALPPEVARASMMLVFMLVQGAAVVVALAMGLATLRELAIIAALLPIVILGNWLGGRAFTRVPPGAWRWIAGGVLGVAAAGAVLKAL